MALARADDINITSQKLSGTPLYLGIIQTTKNNATCSVPFNNPSSRFDPTGLQARVLLLQPDADCRVVFGTVATLASDSTNGLLVAANDYLIVYMAEGYSWVASSGANLRVYELV